MAPLAVSFETVITERATSTVGCYVSDINCDGVTDAADLSTLQTALIELNVLARLSRRHLLAATTSLVSIIVNASTLIYDVNQNGYLTEADFSAETQATQLVATTLESVQVINDNCSIGILLQVRTVIPQDIGVLIQPPIHFEQLSAGVYTKQNAPYTLKKSLVLAAFVRTIVDAAGLATSFYWLRFEPSSPIYDFWVVHSNPYNGTIVYSEGASTNPLYKEVLARYRMPLGSLPGSNLAPLIHQRVDQLTPSTDQCRIDNDDDQNFAIVVMVIVLVLFLCPLVGSALLIRRQLHRKAAI